MQKIFAVLLALVLILGCTSEQNQQPSPGVEIKQVNSNNQSIESVPVPMAEPSPPPPLPEPKLLLFSISTEKDSYISTEELTATVALEVQGELPGVRVTVHGVENLNEIELLNQNGVIHLKEGNSSLNFTINLPSCSYCSRLPAGEYWIFAEAQEDNQTLALANCSINFSAG
ncbi:MAG: hypothetical protein ABIF01_03985 [Candidatus Micrarchaeota archaeon]